MKMEITNKTTLIGGIALVFVMIIQIYSNFSLDSNFREYQEKSVELAGKRFVNEGFSESQANAITSAIRDECFMLNSTNSSKIMMQSYNATMSCLIVLMMTVWAIKKVSKNGKT